MKKPVSGYTNPKDLRNLMANAKRLGHEDIWREAFRRLCVLEGLNYDDPLEQDFYAMLTAYEELLTAKNGKRQPAIRTRQKLRNKGVVQCLEDWATNASVTQGFQMLVENGLAELTGEALVMKHSNRFSERAVVSATNRLRQHGINVAPHGNPNAL
jgi:hypothetical protein